MQGSYLAALTVGWRWKLAQFKLYHTWKYPLRLSCARIPEKKVLGEEFAYFGWVQLFQWRGWVSVSCVCVWQTTEHKAQLHVTFTFVPWSIHRQIPKVSLLITCNIPYVLSKILLPRYWDIVYLSLMTNLEYSLENEIFFKSHKC